MVSGFEFSHSTAPSSDGASASTGRSSDGAPAGLPCIIMDGFPDIIAGLFPDIMAGLFPLIMAGLFPDIIIWLLLALIMAPPLPCMAMEGFMAAPGLAAGLATAWGGGCSLSMRLCSSEAVLCSETWVRKPVSAPKKIATTATSTTAPIPRRTQSPTPSERFIA